MSKRTPAVWSFSRWNINVLTLLLLALASVTGLRAEGIKQVAPTAADQVMLLIDDDDFGNFAALGTTESSRLYIRIAAAGEQVYFGFSRGYRASGVPEFLGTYIFQVKRASDDAVVHGPVLVGSNTENVTTWEEAVAGPAAINGEGYATNDNFHFTASQAGDYYLEFSGVQYLGLWDITVAANGVERPGRVYSRNWAFRTPESDPELPDCGWGEEFNGKLFSYTADGFVTEIDFADSGFQGLSFNVAFNSRGPGGSGDLELDRQSVPGQNLTENAAEHLIFLNNPDSEQFPDGICGDVVVSSQLQCTAEGERCISVALSRPGQIEVILDFNRNGVFDPETDRLYLRLLNDPANLSDCIPWDGLMANGLPPGETSFVDIQARYTQGVQHWALYDAEFLTNGFCINLIRPACAQQNTTDQQLYYDDRNIPDEPGTGAPRDGRMGCACATPACRTFDNFSANVADCSVFDDEVTTGYGDKNTLNTWWYAHSSTRYQTEVPLVIAGIVGDTALCQLTSTELRIDWRSSAAITQVTWLGPQGMIATGANGPLAISVTSGGTYHAEVTDENGCQVTLTHVVNAVTCPIDLSLNKSVTATNPEIGQTLPYRITVHNAGPGIATGVALVDRLPAGLTSVSDLTGGGQFSEGEITWSGLTIGVGETLVLTYRARLVPAYDYRNLAEITAADQPDVDSTPGNGVDTNGDGNCADDAGDEDDGDCVDLVLPACALGTSISPPACDDNGTPTDPTDDTWTCELTVTGANGSPTWRTLGDIQLAGSVGETVVVGPFPIAAGPIQFTVVDDFFESACAETLMIDPPATCSDQCDFAVKVLPPYCDDRDTPLDPTDDVFYFRVTATSLNATGSRWKVGGNVTAAYGDTVLLGPFPVAAGDFSMTISDAVVPGCTQIIAVQAPPPCSDACALTNAEWIPYCDDRATPDPSDDLLYYDILVTSVNGSPAGWQASDGTTGLYGQWTTSLAYPATAAVRDLVITDRGGACSLATTIAWEPAVSECPEPHVDQYPQGVFHQVIAGEINETDARWEGPAGLCWMPGDAWQAGPHFYDRIAFYTPPAGALGEYYTFYLFSEIPPPAGWAASSIDGGGALFRGEYLAADPCRTVVAQPLPPYRAGELLPVGPPPDTAILGSGSWRLARQFSVYLSAGQSYELLTTTWGAAAGGRYRWVIRSEAPAAGLVFPPASAVNVVLDTLYFDLTETFLNKHLNEPYSEALLLGSARLEQSCAWSGLTLQDEILLDDPCAGTLLSRRFMGQFAGEARVLCEQEITFRPLRYEDIILPPAAVSVACDETADLLANGSPSPAYAGWPGVITPLGIVPLPQWNTPNWHVTYEDFPAAAEPYLTAYERRWSLVDVCADSVVQYRQWLTVAAAGPPLLVCPLDNHYCPIVEEEIMRFTTEKDACTAAVFIPEPETRGGCDPASWEIRSEVLRVAANGDTLLLASLTENDDRLLPDLPIGDYFIRYSLESPEGGTPPILCRFRVADLDNPVAICRGDITVGIGDTGQRRLPATLFNLGSYDNCGVITIEARRRYRYDPDSCTPVDTFAYSPWSDHVDLNCCDVGRTVTVELRVADAGLNVNHCSVAVSIVDNTLPYCTGLADIDLSCGDLPVNFDLSDTLQLQSRFGLPEVVDNCSARAIELEPVLVRSGCAIDTVRRRFLAVDAYGNQAATIFEQRIALDYAIDYAIKFPRDVETDCSNWVDTLQLLRTGCERFAVSYQDELLDPIGLECRRIARTFTVVNTCRYDGITPPVSIGRDENCNGQEGEADVYLIERNGTIFVDADADEANNFPAAGSLGGSCSTTANPAGYWRTLLGNGAFSYTQYVRIFDETPPVVRFDSVEIVSGEGEEGACEREVVLYFQLSDACQTGAGVLSVDWDTYDDGQFDGGLSQGGTLLGTWPNYSFRNRFPIGTHRLRVTATDDCGNQGTTDTLFTIVGAPGLRISGSVVTPRFESVDDVTLRLWRDDELLDSTLTDLAGAYTLENTTPPGEGYRLEPSKTGGFDVAVSTLDLLLLQRHLLGLTPFTSPYQFLAADVDGNGHLSILDLLLLQNLLLGNAQAFPNGVSWRFVPREYVFTGSEDGAAGWPSALDLPSLPICLSDQDWFAIKIGDIDGSFAAELAGDEIPRTHGTAAVTVPLLVADVELRPGQSVPVTLELLAGGRQFAGGSFELRWDPAALDLTEVTTGALGASQLGIRNRHIGRLPVVWTREQFREGGRQLLTLHLTPRRAGYLRDHLYLVETRLPARVYDQDLREAWLTLRFHSSTPGENPEPRAAPNPFREELRLLLPASAANARIEIYDVAGRRMWRADDVAPSRHQGEISVSTLSWAPGVYFCLYTTDADTRVLRLVKQ